VFTTQLVLVVLNLDRKIKVEADASAYATGGVLSMKYENEK